MVMRLEQPYYLYLLLLLPLFWGVELYLFWWRKRMMSRFATQEFHASLFPSYVSRSRWLKAGLWSLAYSLMVIALARPQGQPVLTEQIQQARTSFIVLDCSLSMRAQDVAPNRLQAAKESIRVLVDRSPYDRIGLVVFSGTARVVCPATHDQQALLNALSLVSTRSLPTAGSNPACGVRLAIKKFSHLPGVSKVILLFSDGEENTPGQLEETGPEARAAKNKIISVGIGSERGGLIPLGKDFWGKPQYRRYQGRLVRSHLNSEGLRKAAIRSGGSYISWDTPTLTAARIYHELTAIRQEDKRRIKVLAYFEYFPFLSGIAFMLLMLEWVVPVLGRRAV
jgi:Ca-activated chloride channel family protein